MFRKFIEGLVFGAGFAVAFVVIAWLASPLLVPMRIQPSSSAAYENSVVPQAPAVRDAGPDFHELPVEEQIKTASVIALAKYEPAADGKMKAVLKEFLKKEPGTTVYYKVGDEYPELSYYPKEGAGHGDGLAIFFVGSPATVRTAMEYTNDRIHGLGDMPINLFRDKCK